MHESHYITNSTATILIVIVDLQQLHTKTPIRSLIVGVRDFDWYKPNGAQNSQQDFFLLFSNSQVQKVEAMVFNIKTYEVLGFSISTTLFK